MVSTVRHSHSDETAMPWRIGFGNFPWCQCGCFNNEIVERQFYALLLQILVEFGAKCGEFIDVNIDGQIVVRDGHLRFQQSFGNDSTGIWHWNINVCSTSWNRRRWSTFYGRRTQCIQIFAGNWSIDATTLALKKHKIELRQLTRFHFFVVLPSKRNCWASAKRLAIGLAYTLGPRCSTAVNGLGAAGAAGAAVTSVGAAAAGAGAAAAAGWAAAGPVFQGKMENYDSNARNKMSISIYQLCPWSQQMRPHQIHFQR